LKIYDFAQKLSARSGKNAEIDLTGLRPGKK
jgi:FlaA1/EpsC-like NDP-sugar epimerase